MRLLEMFEPVYKWLPDVKSPEQKPVLRTRLLWTALVLVIYFIMGEVNLVGINTAAASYGQLQAIQYILASNLGTLITLGIGPIVLASIVLQLLAGGKLINIDLSNTEDRARFTKMQDLLAIIIAFFEGGAYVGFGFFANSLIPVQPGMALIVILQIVLGAVLVIYLDKVVSKYGIGSGIGLFIAAGVTGSFLWQVFRPPLGIDPTGGLLFVLGGNVMGGQMLSFVANLIPLLFVILIFLLITYAEGVHVNIPVAMGSKAMGGRYPVKLLYVSNMPVILAAALFANIQIMQAIAGKMAYIGQAIGALAWATQVPSVANQSLVQAILFQGFTSAVLFEIGHAVIFLTLLVVLCIIFGKFWVELGGQGTEAVSNQLQRAGMYIPGFRRDPRIIEGVLARYIPPLTILGSLLVGLLAGVSDLFAGRLVSGTGVLLTVGIVYRMYEELARQQIEDMHPWVKKLLGG
ncbi:MAG: preprotein translocase subunit SecY [Candidatus Diapherotrites archaeon]